jgi:uptake hydrogenase large subunit
MAERDQPSSTRLPAPASAGPEGELCLRLRVQGGRVAQAHVVSSRPDVARWVLQGRSIPEIEAAVPLLFSVCSRSQAAASRLACAAAGGATIASAELARCAAAVTSELVREGAWRTLLEWPRWIGEEPVDEAVAAARMSLAWSPCAMAGSRGVDSVRRESMRTAHRIALAVFGTGAAEWLAVHTGAELDRWADAGSTAAARLIRSVRDDDARAAPRGAQGLPIAPTALLDSRSSAALIEEIGDALEADAQFDQHPIWRSAPAETGALARRQADPLLAELLRRTPSRTTARFVARLRELALVLAGRIAAAVGAQGLAAPGGGIAWLENARGLLIHQVRMQAGRAITYRIVAPTQWNFHPCGALASELLGLPAHDLMLVKQRAQRVVHSLDPCVACRIEIDDA